MKRIDNLTNDKEEMNADLIRSFKELNAKLDSNWFDQLAQSPEKVQKERVSRNKRDSKRKKDQTTQSKRDNNTKEVQRTAPEKLIEELNVPTPVEQEEPVPEKADYQEKVLRNKGKKVGKIRVYNKGIKRTLLAVSFVVVGVSAFIAGRNTNKKPVYQVSYNTLSEAYFDEPTYNGILYTVKSGDNLSTIIARYESDPNKQANLLDQIMRYNNLKNSNIIIGDEIYLFGVPSSMLEEYGYSDNFNYFDPMVEISVRFDFLDKVKESLSGIEDAKGYLESINNLRELYDQFKYRYIPGEDDELNEILNELRELSEFASEYGYDFEYNKKAMPLSQATNYKNANERTNN